MNRTLFAAISIAAFAAPFSAQASDMSKAATACRTAIKAEVSQTWPDAFTRLVRTKRGREFVLRYKVYGDDGRGFAECRVKGGEITQLTLPESLGR